MKRDFEKQTGCQVNVKVAGTSDEMVQLMRTGQYDGVSASGNAPRASSTAGDVSPVNVDLVPNYKTIFPDLKDQPYNTFDGIHYGIPHGRGANLLMWNTDDVKPAPTSLGRRCSTRRRRPQYKGKISAYDDPIYIADAAVYLKAHQPDLGITTRTSSNETQFNAAVDLLKQQRPNVGEYWSDAAEADLGVRERRRPGRHDLAVPVLRAEGQRPAGGVEPGEPGIRAQGGRDRLVRHLDDQLAGRASELHVQVDELHRLAEGRTPRSREYFGEAPAQSKACDPSR